MKRYLAKLSLTSSKHGSQAGFSLVELLIAMGVMATGLLALAQTIPTALQGITQSQARTNAIAVAQEQMDALLAEDFTSAALADGSYSQTSGAYLISWTVSDNDPLAGAKRISVVASWAAASGTKTAAISTYLTRQ